MSAVTISATSNGFYYYEDGVSFSNFPWDPDIFALNTNGTGGRFYLHPVNADWMHESSFTDDDVDSGQDVVAVLAPLTGPDPDANGNITVIGLQYYRTEPDGSEVLIGELTLPEELVVEATYSDTYGVSIGQGETGAYRAEIGNVIEEIAAEHGVIFEGSSSSDLVDLGHTWNDLVSGTTVDTYAGDDYIVGTIGDDTINSGVGHDIIYAGRGSNHVVAGAGHDEIHTGDYDANPAVRNFVNAGGGNDTISISSQRGTSVVLAGQGHDNIYGDASRDTFHGGDGHDVMRSGEGNDTLLGGAGRDDLNGGRGRDIIDGGTGNDILAGDLGSDAFVFSRGSGVDRITDFELGWDRLHIDPSLIDTSLTDQAIADQYFRTTAFGDTVFTSADDRLIIENVDDILILLSTTEFL